MVVQRSPDDVEFRLYLPHASAVEVVGDFTRWQEAAVIMERAEDGWWVARARVPAGQHRFSYLVDGRYWMPDYAASGIEHNEHGQWVSRLDVEAAEDASTSSPRRIPGRALESAVRPAVTALAIIPGVGAAAG